MTPFRAMSAALIPDAMTVEPGLVRMLYDIPTGDVYAWDGYFAAHGGIKDRYNLPQSVHLLYYPIDNPDELEFTTPWRYERFGYDTDAVTKLLLDSPNLERILPPGYRVTTKG